jgi:arylsulfatase A-like enzyme
MKISHGAGLLALLGMSLTLLSPQCRRGGIRDHDFERDGILHLTDHLAEHNLKSTPFAGILQSFPEVEDDLSGELHLIPELSTSRRKVWAATTGYSHLESDDAARPQRTEIRIDGDLIPHLEGERQDAEAWQWIKIRYEIDLSEDENYRQDLDRLDLERGESFTFDAVLPDAPVQFEVSARNNWHPLEMALYVDDEFIGQQPVGREVSQVRFAHQGTLGSHRITLRPRLASTPDKQRPTPPRLLVFRIRVLARNDVLLFFVPFERQPGFPDRTVSAVYRTDLDPSGERHPLAEAYRIKHDFAALPSDQPVNPENIKKNLILEDVTLGAIMAPPPSRFEFELKTPPSGILEFGAGIFAYPGSPAGRKTRFQVQAETRDGQTHILYDQVIQRDPGPLRDQIRTLRVDLSRWAEQTILLGFETAPDPLAAGPDTEIGPGLAYWVNPIVFQPGADAPPNVILISLDTLRADHLGCYGYGRPTSPFLDTLAEDGALFEHTYAQSPWTLPSHLSMLFSLNSASHQVYFNDQKINGELPSLATHLKDRGYLTCGLTAGGYVSPIFGFSKGFDRYDNPTKGHKERQGKDEAERLFEVTDRWIEDNHDKPFFLFLHTYQIHDPYVCPPPYNSMFLEDEGSAPWSGLALHALLDEQGGDRDFTPEERANIVALYDGEIRYTDEKLLRPLVRRLKELGIYDKTLLIITSDHGEEFEEHGGWLHGHTLYDEAIRVPLLIKFPGSEYRGRRLGSVVRIIDILPTVMDVLDIPFDRGSIEGLSLLPLLTGKETGDRVFISDLAHKNIPEPCPAMIATNRGRLKFILQASDKGPDTVRAFNLLQDPEERTDISHRAPSVREEVLRLLDQYYRSKETLEKGGERIRMNKELENRLKALGYLR